MYMSQFSFESLLFQLGSLDAQRRALKAMGWGDTPAIDAEYDVVMAELVSRHKDL